MNVFVSKRIVQPNEIDHFNHVNNVVYLDWVQQIAYEHWNELIEGKEVPYVWYTIRHEIDYLKQAVLGDKITLKTWVGETFGVKSIRHVEIYKSDKLLAKTQTTFCMLDAKTKRPTRITETIRNLLLPQK